MDACMSPVIEVIVAVAAAAPEIGDGGLEDWGEEVWAAAAAGARGSWCSRLRRRPGRCALIVASIAKANTASSAVSVKESACARAQQTRQHIAGLRRPAHVPAVALASFPLPLLDPSRMSSEPPRKKAARATAARSTHSLRKRWTHLAPATGPVRNAHRVSVRAVVFRDSIWRAGRRNHGHALVGGTAGVAIGAGAGTAVGAGAGPTVGAGADSVGANVTVS